jgi:hypothetical protein
MYNFQRDKNDRINQGDIFKNITHIEYWEEYENELKISRIYYPYIVILSQDCDLREDASIRAKKKKNDKSLVSALVAPLYNFDQFLDGEHLQDLEIEARKINKENKKGDYTTEYKNLIHNEIPRYHVIEFQAEARLAKSVVDFKHYFTISIEYLERIKKTNFEYPIPFLYRESLCQRFANYLSRIGLPTENETPI